MLRNSIAETKAALRAKEAAEKVDCLWNPRPEIPIIISQNTSPGLKPPNLFIECFRGLESPLPRTKELAEKVT
jgi:hypothetical protein